MPQIDKTATPLLESTLAAVLRDGYCNVFQRDITDACLSVGWSQNALEHANGRAIWNCNLGNVSAFSWPGDYYVIHVQERTHRSTGPGDADVWKYIDMKFRAHDDAIDGARDYWRLFAGRYSPALALFEKGLANPAALKLSALGYYTALPEPYAKGMVQLQAHFYSKVLPELHGREPGPAVKLDAAIAALDHCSAFECGARELAENDVGADAA